MNFQMREAEPKDFQALYRLNQSEVPHVGDLDFETFEALVKKSFVCFVVSEEDDIAGFVLVLDEKADYESLNFLWFKSRYPKFLYIDRVVVSKDFRKRGVGRALYSAVEGLAQSQSGLVTLEVNIRPPNPESMGFHEQMGFKVVGEQDTEQGKKRVALMLKECGSKS